MNAYLCLIITYLAGYVWELSSILSLFFEEIRTDIHFRTLYEVKFVVLLLNVRTNLTNVKHLVVVDVDLLADKGGRDT